MVFDSEGMLALEVEIAALRPALVVIDPLIAYMGAKVDTYRANQTRAILAPLAEIAERHDISILAVRHLRKSESSRAIYRGQGSIDFTASARSVLLAGHDPDYSSKCALVHIKGNLAALGKPTGYTIAEGDFSWTGTSNLTADRILAVEGGGQALTAQH